MFHELDEGNPTLSINGLLSGECDVYPIHE